ncbi:hypothetical protein [Pseudomonas aeruginosa]|uniref:hypothetical protein n=1 Tax=Pseudomonas aeruginosa TaxID=287 RepID=UPI00222E74BD|nr:hypothetical protein [Pseudomonas aeruginosa]HBO0799787.1 hypothetical protein [Pseudomonas aeruginosa]HBO1471921.1 hypothetical protein [Pseudomonas aeruginosa]HBO7099525.1 hypothetical protein [Pseudomonas aeruginosa]HCF5279431.1 hypothetical protein [Pseudomonas aeruginosa]HCF6000332.1 hypothetical protein [Pseudomonas aeruginosa]
MSSTQHQLIEQCATRLRSIVKALDNIHDSTPHRWSTDLDDLHSSAESLLAPINDHLGGRTLLAGGSGSWWSARPGARWELSGPYALRPGRCAARGDRPADG